MWSVAHFSLESHWTRSRHGRGGSENKLQVTDSHGSTLHSVQSDFGQHGNHLAKIEINMVTEVRDQASPFICGSSKIDGKQPSAWLQNPAYLGNSLSAGLVG